MARHALEGRVAHLLRLPGLTVIAVFLTMANRSAEMHAIDSADGEQGDFEIEVHHPSTITRPAPARPPCCA